MRFSKVWLPLLLLATPAFGAALLHLGDSAGAKFDVSDTGRVSVGPTAATVERFLIEDQTPGDRTFTIRSLGVGGTVLDRLSLEKNPAEPYDFNIRNVVMQLGSTSTAGSALPVQIQFNSATGAVYSPITLWRGGSNSVANWRLNSGGTMFSYCTGQAGTAWWLGNNGEANPRLSVDQFGGMAWGPGGATVPDVTLARASAGVVALNGSLAATGNLSALSLNVSGSIATTGRTLTAPATLQQGDSFVLADSNAAPFTVTLADATTAAWREVTVKRKNAGANDVTVAATAGQLIDGRANWVLTSQYAGVVLVSDAVGWQIKSHLGSVQ